MNHKISSSKAATVWLREGSQQPEGAILPRGGEYCKIAIWKPWVLVICVWGGGKGKFYPLPRVTRKLHEFILRARSPAGAVPSMELCEVTTSEDLCPHVGSLYLGEQGSGAWGVSIPPFWQLHANSQIGCDNSAKMLSHGEKEK